MANTSPSFLRTIPNLVRRGPKINCTERATQSRYTLRIERFSETEVDEHLAELLRAYRAFHLEPDEAEAPQQRDAEAADKSRRLFQAMFGNQLTSAGNEEFLLYNEEEDVLDMFAVWTRQYLQQIPSQLREEKFEDLSASFERLVTFPAAALIKRIHLSIKIRDGSMLMAGLPYRGIGDAVGLDLDGLHHVFCDDVVEGRI